MYRQTNNATWDYFERDHSNKRGTCRLCSQVLSYKTTITNLKQHLKKRHPAAYEELMLQLAADVQKTAIQPGKDDDDSVHSDVQVSDIWSFFEKETGGRVRCVICRETLSSHAGTLRAHLRQDHPKLAVQTSDQESDNETQKDTHTEVVYLYDSDPKTPKKEPSKKAAPILDQRRSVYKVTKEPERRKRRYSSTDSKAPDEEELEKFGKYVTCLLKTMPKDLCTQLQLDIINLIMTAKINKMARKETSVLPPTVQTVEVANNSGNITLPVTLSGSEENSPFIVTVADNGKMQHLIANNTLRSSVSVEQEATES